MMHRRLARDYETLPASSEAMIHVASVANLTKPVTDETTPTCRGLTRRQKEIHLDQTPTQSALFGTRFLNAAFRPPVRPVRR